MEAEQLGNGTSIGDAGVASSSLIPCTTEVLSVPIVINRARWELPVSGFLSLWAVRLDSMRLPTPRPTPEQERWGSLPIWELNELL